MAARSRGFLAALVVSTLPLFAQEAGAGPSAEELAKAAQNPVAAMISLPFQVNTTFGYGIDALDERDTQTVLNIQPVVPVGLNAKWNLISRTIVPLIRQPNIPGSGTTGTLGDITETLFFSPAKPGKVIWGLGPVVTVPTAVVGRLGSGKVSLGPGLVLLTMKGPWVVGCLTQNTWSVAGQGDRADVNAFLFQYFVNYNFEKGWYLTSSPAITANWNAANSDDRWTVPFGLGFGRLFRMGKQPVNASLAYYYNAVRPTGAVPSGPHTVRFQIQLLFPKKR